MNGFPIDDDIVDRILTFLTSFEDLQATILVSKSLYSIFQTRPKSIIRAVASNVIGPALPQALLAARWELGKVYLRTSVPSERDTISSILPREAHVLTRYANECRDLEDIFSLRHKDRTSQTSQLNPTESHRFTRALYRLMTLPSLFPDAFPDDDYDDDGDEEALYTPRIVMFLEDLKTEEISQLQSVVFFIGDLGRWAYACDGDASVSLAMICARPESVLHSFREKSSEMLEEAREPPALNIITSSISTILESRNLKPPDSSTPDHWRSILVDVVGQNDTCTQCQKVEGPYLWGKSNWRYLYGASDGIFSPEFLPQLMKGHLRRSRIVCRYFQDSDFLHVPGFYETLMQEIFDIKSDEFVNWTPEDWLCTDCFKHLLSSHLHIWLLQRKRQEGEAIQEDCWYGYNCRTQTHRPLHEAKLNHLCEPTRGD
ncbi:hypothetical protein C8J56DRAFT_1116448 [Mycena floridula]|nr:hypothetical protein C8J56DRAFT_1116448 [Mycena floridula]